MKNPLLHLPLALTLLSSVYACNLAAQPQALNYQTQTLEFGDYQFSVQLPENSVLELLNAELDQPRMLTFADNGDLLIGSRSGNIYRFSPPYTTPQILLQLDDYPHSVALRDGEMLIARTSGLYRAPYQPGQAEISPDSVELVAKVPGGRGHNSRTVRIGPDQRVYLSLGISGNCSDEYIGAGYDFNDQRGGVMVLAEEDGNARWLPYASGLRNPIGFDWQPQSGIMYANNNGPDHWGYEQPREYFSRLTEGSFHGMPWFQYADGEIKRDDCIRQEPPLPAQQVSIPVASFPARNAPIGVAFVPENTFDEKLSGDAVVALHGSWATLPDGGGGGDPASRRDPKLVVVRFEQGNAVQVDDLVSGFQLEDGRRWARPTGVAVGPDGALYFASDGGINGLFRLRTH